MAKKRRTPKKSPKKLPADLRAHARRRALERYGLHLYKEDFERLHQLIREGRARFLKRQSHTRTIWLIEWQDKELLTVYHSGLSHICSFLPEEAKRRFVKKGGDHAGRREVDEGRLVEA